MKETLNLRCKLLMHRVQTETRKLTILFLPLPTDRLIPYHYSLGHIAYNSGIPMSRPMAMDFADDEFASTLTSQWMDGDSILVAPVLNQDNSSSYVISLLSRIGIL